MIRLLERLKQKCINYVEKLVKTKKTHPPDSYRDRDGQPAKGRQA